MLCHMHRASVFYPPRQRASGARVNAGPAAANAHHDEPVAANPVL
jgi:hypothetical protein